MGQQETAAAPATDTHPLEHSRAEVQGFNVIEVTHRDPKYWTGHSVFVGYGAEGRTLSPPQARKLADTILKAANAAVARQQAAEVPL